jgi:hypothetical protein
MTTAERPIPLEDDSRDPAAKMPTCCPSHADWAELLAHLRREFARNVDPVVLIRELHRAKSVVEFAGLDDADQLFVAERITRQQLDMIVTGRREDARLDPQPRVSRRTLS